MLAAAAMCPYPPLLVPELATGAAQETVLLREACLAAVGEVLSVGAVKLLVVGVGPHPGPVPARAIGSLAPYGVAVTVDLASDPSGRADDPPDPADDRANTAGERPMSQGSLNSTLSERVTLLPLSLTVGVWLVRQAGYQGAVDALVVTETATPAECAAIGTRVAAEPESTALLVMGDGSARRSPASPALPDARAIPFDDAVVAALKSADIATLAALDPELARELLVTGRAPLQVLAAAATGQSWAATVHYADAPYGVGYPVATWLPAEVPAEVPAGLPAGLIPRFEP